MDEATEFGTTDETMNLIREAAQLVVDEHVNPQLSEDERADWQGEDPLQAIAWEMGEVIGFAEGMIRVAVKALELSKER